jgi:hypothetical protein
MIALRRNIVIALAVFLISIFWLSGCTPAVNMNVTPYFEVGNIYNFARIDTALETGLISAEQQVCVYVIYEPIWESQDGHKADELVHYIARHKRLMIDSVEVPSDSLEMRQSTDAHPIWGSAQKNKIIGEVGGPLAVCFFPSNISNGPHIVTLEVTSTSGKVHSHTWKFVKDDTF